MMHSPVWETGDKTEFTCELQDLINSPFTMITSTDVVITTNEMSSLGLQ